MSQQQVPEKVLVVRRSLFDQIGSFHGLNSDIGKYLPIFLEPGNHFFVPRAEAEEDPSLKQLIPYVVITAGDKLLHYRRGSGSGETRLLRKDRSASAVTSTTATVWGGL